MKQKQKENQVLKNLKHLKSTDKNIQKDMETIVNVLEATGIRDFVRHLRSPWRIIWTNFLAGIFRGLGIVVGMTVVIGLVIWILNSFVNFPVIGQYFQDLLLVLQKINPPAVTP